MKKILKIIMTLSFILLFSVKVFAMNISSFVIPETKEKDDVGFIEYLDGYTEENITKDYKALFINGELIKDVSIITKNNNTLVPLRLVTESLGGKVIWKDSDRSVTIHNDNIIIIIKIDEIEASVNGVSKKLNDTPKIYKDVTYVPLRFISENLNYNVSYYDPNLDVVSSGIISQVPNIFIDKKYSNPEIISKEDGLIISKRELLKGLENFSKKLDNEPQMEFSEGQKDEVIKFIKNDIEKLKYAASFSKYHEYKGLLYNIFVDKLTGDIYLIDIRSGSTVKKLDINDKYLFTSKYLIG